MAAGNVGYLLLMTGHEKIIRNNNFLGASLLLVLSIVLIPEYGIIGAASAYSLAVITQNIVAFFLVKKHLGFFMV
ncbi:MAG: polysaccharide biosynthesis C-terminal domain-containing protein [Emcibacteraceae bacterium]|nr:polysaccharide biosynthesis C-terminal domain-containing protein [Emcibacteraceae bacterium]